MNTEYTVSNAAAIAACKLLREYLEHGDVQGINHDDVQQMLEALENADRIVIEKGE